MWTEDERMVDLWPAVRATLEIEAKRRSEWLPRTVPAMLRTAASVVIAVGLGWMTGTWMRPGEPGPHGSSMPTSIEDVMGPLGLDEFATSSATGLQGVFEAGEEDEQEEVP
jgi:hypothetical protein